MINELDPAEYEHAEMATLLLSGDEVKDAFLKFYCEKKDIQTFYSFKCSDELKHYVRLCISEDCGCPFDTIICYQDNENIANDPFFEAFEIVEIQNQ